MSVLDTRLYSESLSLPTGTSTGTGAFEFTYPVIGRTEEFVIHDPTRSHLKKPVMLIVEPTESGKWVAHHPIIRTHGYGRSDVEAAQDFHDMMIGLFLELIDSEEELAPHLRQDLDYLREIIVEDSVR